MLSAFPIQPDSLFGNPFSAFETGFTPWDCPEFFPTIQSPEPVISNSESDALQSTKSEPDVFPSPLNPVISSSGSGSDEPNRNHGDSDGPKHKRGAESVTVVGVVDERKRRRMISNRESARRSRMRKQKHLENLRNQANRFRVENRELSNRLRFFLYHCHNVQTENNQLRSEYGMLRQKLSEIRQLLVFRQLQPLTSAWPCNTTTTTVTSTQ